MPWRRERLPTPVFWPEEVHGLYRLWGRKELDTTEQLSLSFLFTIFTELSKHHHCLMLEHGYCPQKKAPTQEWSLPDPSPWQPLFHFCPVDLPILDTSCKWTHNDSLPSLSARFSKFKVRGTSVWVPRPFSWLSHLPLCVSGHQCRDSGVVPTFGPLQMMLLLVFMYTCGCVASFLLDPTSGPAGSHGPSA